MSYLKLKEEQEKVFRGTFEDEDVFVADSFWKERLFFRFSRCI